MRLSIKKIFVISFMVFMLFIPSISANNEVNIKDIFLFFITLITLANTIPSNIKKYNVGGIGMFVRK